MKSLVVYFGEPSPIVTEAVHLIFSVVGGLDLTQPTKYHRFGLNIGEDFIGYPVRAPRDVSFAEIHSVAAQLACIFGAAVTAPLDLVRGKPRPSGRGQERGRRSRPKD